MMLLNEILGSSSDEGLSGQLHDLEHRGAVEFISLPSADIARRRLRAVTDQGTECGIALPRERKLANGAVMYLDEYKAIVIRVEEESWLTLVPVDAEAALELGYHAGNLHWRIRFDGTRLLVPLEGPAENYLNRIQPMLDSGRVGFELPRE